MAIVKSQFNIGDTIDFTDVDGNRVKDTICQIEFQLTKGFPLYVLYRYGDMYDDEKAGKVSEHYLLKQAAKKRKYEQQ